MSKIGRQPIVIPAGVEVTLDGGRVSVKGSKGELSRQIPRKIEVKVTEGKAIVSRKDSSKPSLSLHGTIRALIANMVKGVSEGFERSLELVGTGFRAEASGNSLVLTVGFSHPVKIEAPEGVAFKIEKNIITVSGIDKEVVGQVAADIRAVRPPEPYKGKGIKYVEEIVRRKPGKAAAAKAVAA